MKCVICKQGETQSGTATVTLERANLTLVVKRVPAEVCQNCEEEYVGEETALQLFKTAEEVAQAGAQVDIREYMTV